MELKHRPNSRASKFFNELRVRCTSTGCNEFIPYRQLTQHEMFQCPQRVIHCPAPRCPYIGRPTELLQHSIRCPLHFVYCQLCDSKYPVIEFGHSCIKALQAKSLTNYTEVSNTKRLTAQQEQPNDSLVLRANKTFAHPDNDSLDGILNKVRISRGRLLFNLKCEVPEDDLINHL